MTLAVADQALPFNLVNENKKRKKLFIQKLPSKIVDIEVYFLKVGDLESFLIMKQQQTIELYKQFVCFISIQVSLINW